MAITNQEAIKYSNEKIRLVSDLFAQLYNLGKSVSDEWDSRSMGTLIPNDAGEIMVDSAYGTDGTDGDGRPVITGQDINRVIILLVKQFITDFEASSNLKLILALRVAVNTIR